MLTMLAALILMPQAGQTISIPAKQSVWVYEHAGDPGGDEFLRIWGVGGAGAPEHAGDNQDFSFGYLRLDVGGVPAGKPKKATLILHNIAPAGFHEADVKDTPLQARSLTGVFDSTAWDYSKSSTVAPGLATTVFGTSKLAGSLDKGTPAEIDIDLLEGPNDFAAALAQAKGVEGHNFYFALTSAIEASRDGGDGKGGVYKVYSAAAKTESLRPVLKLEY